MFLPVVCLICLNGFLFQQGIGPELDHVGTGGIPPWIYSYHGSRQIVPDNHPLLMERPLEIHLPEFVDGSYDTLSG